jgi:hypothetical protein
MIVVIGGQSRTGRGLIRLLREVGAPLRILTRAAENPGDPDAMPGDLARPGTLDAAMAARCSTWPTRSPAPTPPPAPRPPAPPPPTCAGLVPATTSRSRS